MSACVRMNDLTNSESGVEVCVHAPALGWCWRHHSVVAYRATSSFCSSRASSSCAIVSFASRNSAISASHFCFRLSQQYPSNEEHQHAGSQKQLQQLGSNVLQQSRKSAAATASGQRGAATIQKVSNSRSSRAAKNNNCPGRWHICHNSRHMVISSPAHR